MCCRVHWGTLTTWQRILGPRSILLIRLLRCGRYTAGVSWKGTWHCLKLLWPWLKPVLIVVLRVPKLLFLLVIEGCILFRWTTQSIAFNLELCWLILCLFIIHLWWPTTSYHHIGLIQPLQWLSWLLLKRNRWHSICLSDIRVERWDWAVLDVGSDSSPYPFLLLQFIVLVLELEVLFAKIPILLLKCDQLAFEALHVLGTMKLLKLDCIDDLGEEHSRVGNIRHDLVQLLLLP